MTDVTLYELLGLSKEQSDEIAKKVRAFFSESRSPADWIGRMIDEFHIADPKSAEIFACGWFAGRYAGVSEIFRSVQREVERMEKDQVVKAEKESKYSPQDGYA
ncbi:MAG: hypothetical protein A4E48_02348 [Methanosaeta sp. PtaU1.Bin060]|jgi:hypothetical protein|nr:MAG: hypothetical protein A4E48_02348 [Methanosaeta sp. PtaU1.Bin060]